MMQIAGTGDNKSVNRTVVRQIKKGMQRLPASLMPFNDFMDICHYGRGGFYQDIVRIGEEEGSFFTTAPHSHGNLLGSSLGVFIANAWRKMGRPGKLILAEAGAGEGKMMRDILDHLKANFPAAYRAADVSIIEISGGLIGRQKQMLAGHSSKRIKWLNSSILKTSLRGDYGVFVSNELPDALPFSLHSFQRCFGPEVEINGSRVFCFKELYVGYDGRKDRFKFTPVNEAVYGAVDEDMKEWRQHDNRSLIEGHDFSASGETVAYQLFLLNNSFEIIFDSYVSFVACAHRSLSDFVRNALGSFRAGANLFIDYGVVRNGFPRFGLSGSGVNYFTVDMHNAEQALKKPGLVDYTCSVDFRWTAREAKRLGAEVFTVKRNSFLEASGFSPMVLGELGSDHLVQIHTKGGLAMKDILDLPSGQYLEQSLI